MENKMKGKKEELMEKKAAKKPMKARVVKPSKVAPKKK
jgi:hypothetical protein